MLGGMFDWLTDFVEVAGVPGLAVLVLFLILRQWLKGIREERKTILSAMSKKDDDIDELHTHLFDIIKTTAESVSTTGMTLKTLTDTVMSCPFRLTPLRRRDAVVKEAMDELDQLSEEGNDERQT